MNLKRLRDAGCVLAFLLTLLGLFTGTIFRHSDVYFSLKLVGPIGLLLFLPLAYRVEAHRGLKANLIPILLGAGGAIGFVFLVVFRVGESPYGRIDKVLSVSSTALVAAHLYYLVWSKEKNLLSGYILEHLPKSKVGIVLFSIVVGLGSYAFHDLYLGPVGEYNDGVNYAATARAIWNEGRYMPEARSYEELERTGEVEESNRIRRYPNTIYSISLGVLAKISGTWSLEKNGAISLLSFVIILVFSALLLLRFTDDPFKACLVTLVLALQPIVITHITRELSTPPSLALLLVALYLISAGRPVLSGAIFALAVGFREHCLLAIPFLPLFSTQEITVRNYARSAGRIGLGLVPVAVGFVVLGKVLVGSDVLTGKMAYFSLVPQMARFYFNAYEGYQYALRSIFLIGFVSFPLVLLIFQSEKYRPGSFLGVCFISGAIIMVLTFIYHFTLTSERQIPDRYLLYSTVLYCLGFTHAFIRRNSTFSVVAIVVMMWVWAQHESTIAKLHLPCGWKEYKRSYYTVRNGTFGEQDVLLGVNYYTAPSIAYLNSGSRKQYYLLSYKEFLDGRYNHKIDGIFLRHAWGSKNGWPDRARYLIDKRGNRFRRIHKKGTLSVYRNVRSERRRAK